MRLTGTFAAKVRPVTSSPSLLLMSRPEMVVLLLRAAESLVVSNWILTSCQAVRWITSRGDSQTTHAIILTDSIRLLQKVKSGMGSPDWKRVEKSCRCIALDMPERRETTEQTDWRVKRPSNKWLASRKIWSVEKLETLPAGTKPRTSHHRSPAGERRWMVKC